MTVTRDDAFATIKPYDGFKVAFKVEFDHPVHKKLPSESIIDFSSTSFVKEVCRARTFGSMNDLELLKSKNLALGASVSNAIAFGDEDILNEEGLRFEDEIVKHKMLDKNEPHQINAAFSLDRFVSGKLVDEHGAAAVAH